MACSVISETMSNQLALMQKTIDEMNISFSSKFDNISRNIQEVLQTNENLRHENFELRIIIDKLRTESQRIISQPKSTKPPQIKPPMLPNAKGADFQHTPAGDYATAAAKYKVPLRQHDRNTNKVNTSPPKRTLPSTQAKPTSTTDKTAQLPEPLFAATEGVDDDGYKKVSSRKNNHPKRQARSRGSAVIRATGEADANLLTADRQKHLHIWNFQSGITEGNIFSYLKNKLNDTINIKQVKITKPVTKHEDHNFFVLSMPKEYFETFISPSLWPQRVSMQQWFISHKNKGTPQSTQPQPFRT